jgi:hypothetical protein
MLSVMVLPCSELICQERVTVSVRPTIELGGDVRSALGMVVGAAVLSDGVIAVADAAEASVRFFARDGSEVGRVGRLGRGPGEFQRISWMGQCGADSLYVWDLTLRRLTLIGPDRRVAPQASVPQPGSVGAVPATLACSRQGAIAFLGRPAPPGAERSRSRFLRVHGPLVSGRLSQSKLAILDTVPIAEVALTANNWFPRPLGRTTALAVGSSRIYLGTADSASFQVLELSGEPVVRVPVRGQPRRPDAEHLERSLSDLTGYLSGSLRDGFRKTLGEIPLVDFLPPYSALHTDPVGNVFVVTSIPGDSVTKIDSYSSDGAQLGRLQIPYDASVLEVGPAYLLASFTGIDGEPRVGLFAVSRRR